MPYAFLIAFAIEAFHNCRTYILIRFILKFIAFLFALFTMETCQIEPIHRGKLFLYFWWLLLNCFNFLWFAHQRMGVVCCRYLLLGFYVSLLRCDRLINHNFVLLFLLRSNRIFHNNVVSLFLIGRLRLSQINLTSLFLGYRYNWIGRTGVGLFWACLNCGYLCVRSFLSSHLLFRLNFLILYYIGINKLFWLLWSRSRILALGWFISWAILMARTGYMVWCCCPIKIGIYPDMLGRTWSDNV